MHTKIVKSIPGILRIGGGLIAACLVFAGWFCFAGDYSDSVFYGTYHLSQNGERYTLHLLRNHTFREEIIRNGNTRTANGTWRTFGEGHIAFSNEFIAIFGQELGADGTSYGHAHKALGLFISSLTLTNYDVEWYGKVADSDTTSIVGTYNGDEPGVPATLTVKPDGSFEQSISYQGATKSVRGTWHQSKNGDLTFSKEFLKTTGDSLSANETATASDSTGTCLQIEIDAHSPSGEPTFRKALFTSR